MSNIKIYKDGQFRFGFMPEGRPMKGMLKTECPEREPYVESLNLSTEKECGRYAEKAAEKLGVETQLLREALSNLRAARFEEIEAAEEVSASSGDAPPPIPYSETDHGIMWSKPTQHGPRLEPLTNFTARITGDVVEDDGAAQRRSFAIEAGLGSNLSTFEVPGERFPGMGWVPEHLGASAIVYPGMGAKDHARAAIQMLSGRIPTRRLYTHTGWRKLAAGWTFLHGGGAIGPEGPVPGVEVSLGEGGLADYSLPNPLEAEELAHAILVSLHFLELAPPEVVYPLFCATYRAPLSEASTADFSVHVAGPTGTFKTEVTALCQAHYGANFNGRNLPANWTSTENTLEKQAFASKDAILTVDDFAPGGTTYDVARQHNKADRLLRGQGNRTGRGRMGPDGKLRPVYYPRGVIVSSGEDTPRGHSLRARMVVLELEPGAVDLPVLTELQRAAAEGLLAGSMAGYVSHVAGRMDELKETLPDRQCELRATAAGAGKHARTPDIVASLALGFETFLEFALEAGAVTDERADELREECWRALGKMADSQAEHQSGEEPTRQFLDLLSAAIAGGDAHLASQKANGEPDRCERWGWRARTVRTNDGDMEDWQPQGRRVGWLGDDGSLLLEPGAAYATAQDLARRQGTSLPIGQRTLYRRMVEKGLVAKRDSARDRNTTRATIAGERKVVVHLVPGVLSPDGPNGPNGPEPGGGGGLGPKPGAVPTKSSAETARENGPDSPTNGLPGPLGPLGPVSGEEGAGSKDEGEDEPGPRRDREPEPAVELRRLDWARADALWHGSEGGPEVDPGDADPEEDPVARRLRDVVGIYSRNKDPYFKFDFGVSPWVGSSRDVFDLGTSGEDGRAEPPAGWPSTAEEMNDHLKRIVPAMQRQTREFYDPGFDLWYEKSSAPYHGDPKGPHSDAKLHAELWKKEGTAEELWVLVALKPRVRPPAREIEEAVWHYALTGESGASDSRLRTYDDRWHDEDPDDLDIFEMED